MKSRIFVTLVILFTFQILAFAQYEFTIEKQLDCSEIKNQGNTGTCWSFATSSFLESEFARMGKKGVDVSEMFIVRNIYKDKANNYVLRQGKANFSQGSLAHDVIRAADRNGIYTENIFSGRIKEDSPYNHSELEAGLKGFLDGVIGAKKPSPQWKDAVNAILDIYIGGNPRGMDTTNKIGDPIAYAKSLGFNAKNYVSLTSFTHHPFGESFILEIPDNYSNGSFHNVSMDDLVKTIDHALDKGYSVAWDGDVSEAGFSSKEGIAILPTDSKRADLFTMIGEEVTVTQAMRQEAFENYVTTDDHLMHITGTAKDQKGNKYYIIKNSWGERGPYKGVLYMSLPYLKMKTVGVLLHKDGVPGSVGM